MYKIAIIGAGIISDFHVQGWKNIPNIEIHTVVDLNEDLAKEKAEKQIIKKFYKILKLQSAIFVYLTSFTLK
jgi:predicted dehydrogenase